MVSTAVSEPMAPPVAGSRAAWPWPAIVFFAALWFVLCRHLSGEWSVNEQYNYGWFVPLFAAYLFWLRWAGRPGKVESRRAAERGARSDSEFRRPVLLLSTSAFLLVLLLLLPLRLFEVANPDWR